MKRSRQKKWTNQTIDAAIASRSITRVTDCTNVAQPSTTPIAWSCDVCSWTWNASADNVLNKLSGCPKCAGNLPYTLETLNARLVELGRTALRCVELGTGNRQFHRKALFQGSCGHTWTMIVHNVITHNQGCPECNYNLSKPVTTSSGERFHSKLEYAFWESFHARDIKYTLLRQQRYTQTRRLTCDYVIPELKLWVEISGGMMLKRPAYKKALDEKKKLVEDMNQTFVVLSTVVEINRFLDNITRGTIR